jgi:hypothetical protein
LLERRTEGIVQRVLSQLEVAEQPDQGRQDPPRLQAVNGIHFLPHLFSGLLSHDESTIPRVAMVFQSRISGVLKVNVKWLRRTKLRAAAKKSGKSGGLRIG